MSVCTDATAIRGPILFDPRVVAIVGQAYDLVAREKQQEAVFYDNLQFVGARARRVPPYDGNLIALDPIALASIQHAITVLSALR